MAGFYTGDWDNPQLEAAGSALVPSSTGDVLEATAGNALWSNTARRLASGEGAMLDQGVAVDDLGNPLPAGAPAPMLAPEDATKQYGIPGLLSFDAPVTASTAQELHDAKRAGALRADVIARSQGNFGSGWAGQGATSLALGLLDPVNLAAGLIPGVGEARFAALLGEGALARAGAGATAGMAGMAALEPLNALLDHQDHEDWTMAGALRDIAFGGLLGGGAHVLGGAAADALRGRPNPLTARMEAAPFETRDMALRGSVGQLADGRPVDVQPALDLVDRARPAQASATGLPEAFQIGPNGATADLRAGLWAKLQAGDLTELGRPSPVLEAAKAAMDSGAIGDQASFGQFLDRYYGGRRSAAAAPPAAPPGSYAAFTPSGTRVDLQPSVMEAGAPIASHAADGTVNPAYPAAAGLQPRDRSSAASQAQVMEMAAKLEPSRLGPSPEAASGAPIVDGSSGVVLSGNGRTAAIRRMYAEPQYAAQAAAYRAHIEGLGFDTAGLAQPMLVGRTTAAMTDEQLRAFTREANERQTLGLSTAEQARADAGRAARAVAQFQPGAIDGAGNRDFVRAFMAQVPAEERGGMLSADGSLSADGERRIRSALLANAYGDALGPTLERMLNGDTEGMKAVAGALTDEAGPWGALRRAAADGTIPPGLDITPQIGEAVQLLDRARQMGRPVAEMLAQTDLAAAPVSDAAASLLRLMFQDDALRRPVSRARLGELLDRYVDQAMEAQPGPDMFGAPPTGPGDVLRAVARGSDQAETAADALQAMTARAAEPAAHPEDAPAAAANADAVQRAPQVPPDRSAALAEAVTAADAMAARVQTELAAGRLTEADAAELRAADAAAEDAEGNARAFEAACACLVSGDV